ncbi:MAG: histidine--tRNA ligase [FCB group bacterium]|nr:histidine--tRNA ligase [FCB group bacterium]
MTEKFRSPKGTRDILPDETLRWQELERILHEVMPRYGYGEIRTPVFETTRLFSRGVGEETDIVSKEMYSWVDQGGDALTLRPELTAPVVRAFIQHNLGAANPLTKVYYCGPLFRRERPQKGRFRQFHQLGVEAFGSEYPELDAEIIALAWTLFQELGLRSMTVKLNSIGSGESRDAFRRALKSFLEPHLNNLSDVSRHRFTTNPLRILDTKVPHEIEILRNAPRITDYLDPDDQEHFDRVQALLDALDIPYQLEPNLVRGLDYYTRTTFEITSDSLGSQDALCGGGRYDGLVETLGGKATPGIGFAAGIERLLMAIAAESPVDETDELDVYIVSLGESAIREAQVLAQSLRRQELSVGTDFLRRSLKAQLREANRLHARQAVVLGENEIQSGKALLKDLTTGEQTEVPLADLPGVLTA